jgi:hypothetical protein
VPEKTASSFSGRGAHHYKSCAEGLDNGLADIQVEFHAEMMTVPLDAGFCPERWKQAVDVMLEKVPGISRSDKLRIIQLLEADLNQLLRIAFVINITRIAKDYEGTISEHQYGRSHKTCMTPVLNTLLTIQIRIQTKVEGIVFDNDAKGCYDMIISGIALACLKMIGYSSNSIRMLGLLWAQLEHHIATGYGVSDKNYLPTLEKLLYGIGQEGCASLIMWALLNQHQLTALGDKFDCIRLEAVDGVDEHLRPGDAFVDYTTTGVKNDDTTMEPVDVEVTELTPSEEYLIGKMHMIIQFFLDLLQVTGGVLAPEKCVWFLIYHRRKDGKARQFNMKESHRGIAITSWSTGTVSGAEKKSPEEGHITLSFQISGDGKCTAKKKDMKENAILFGEAIMSSTMWIEESAMAYNAFYMPRLGYGTPATTLTKKDCEEIQRPVVNAILQKMGIARSAPISVVFGKAQFGGLVLTHLAVLQVHTRIQYLLGHLRCGDATGHLMQMLLEYTQLECGYRENPLAQDYNSYSALLINKNWITEVWEHIQTCKAKVEIDGLWQPTENKVQDIVIMESLIASGRFTNRELKEINYCRIHLQAFYISDITTIKGKDIEAWAGRGHTQAGRQSTREWPIQQRPIAWKAWKEALEYLYSYGDIGEPLGDWKSENHQIMEWYLDAQSSSLYHHV